MKTTLLILLASASLSTCAMAQGIFVINPVPVTNGVTGALADSTVLAALYFGPAGTAENSLVLLSPAAPLVNGYAQFGSQTIIPALPSGSSIVLGVRAWSGGYPSYESAVASGLPSVLAGRSILATVTLGGSPLPPPVPSPVIIPGFTIYPVPEPSTCALLLAGTAMLLYRHRWCHPARRHYSVCEKQRRERAAGGWDAGIM
jgi:hypothetical protein